MNKSNAFIRKSFRNCCYVSQHYSSHLRLTRQQDWTTSSGVTTGKSIGTWAGYYRMSFDFEPGLTLPNTLTVVLVEPPR